MPEQASLPLEPAGARAPAWLQAAALAAPPGHWDELREPGGALRPLWQRFAAQDGAAARGAEALAEIAARIARRVRDDGASFNVYAGDGVSSPHQWPLSPLPLLVGADEWQGIAAGVRQRARLLEAVLADVYSGHGRLLREGLLPANLVLAHPQYLRPMVGLGCPQHLQVLAFDLARGPEGAWWLVGQRSQAPSGLGYMLENRLICAEQFPEAFRGLAVQRLGGAFRSLLDGLLRQARACCAPGEQPRLALLTPGAHNETYFEHAFLARYLGIPLVEGADLTVRGQRVYLKSLQGLQRIHGLLRRVDDEYLDPLELRADSQLGVPGLLQALRARQLVLANAPGAGWLESPGLAAFWPGVAQALLGEPLQLPAAGGWWCGEASAWARSRRQLHEAIVVPTFPASDTTRTFAPFAVAELDAAAEVLLAQRIDADPAAHTLKDWVRPSQQPVWQQDRLEPRAAVLRVFALADGAGGWTVLPGGLTRVAQQRGGLADALLTMQAGCASCDTWVLTEGPQAVDPTTLLPPPLSPAELARAERSVSSRAAENLFWLGRYSERAENQLRLVRALRPLLAAAAAGGGGAPLRVLDRLARQHGLLESDAPAALQQPQRLATQLQLALSDVRHARGLAYTLQRLAGCAAALRERLSPAQAQLLQQLGPRLAQGLQGQADPDAALAACDEDLAALGGLQADRMTRDDGWRLLSCGRQIERLHLLADVLLQGLCSPEPGDDLSADDDGFALLLTLFDSTITYRAQFPGRRERAALLQLLVMDAENPRALAWVAGTLRERLLRLARNDPAWRAAQDLPDPRAWRLEALIEPAALAALLQRCIAQALQLSTEIGQRFFAHVEAPERQVWS